MQKKLLILLSALCLFCLVIAGCGENVSNSASNSASNSSISSSSSNSTVTDSRNSTVDSTSVSVSTNQSETSENASDDSSDSSSLDGSSTPGEDLPQTETEGFIFGISADKTYYTVKGYAGTSAQVVIPEKYNNLPVRTIGSYAFFDCTFLQSVTIPDSVELIDDYAFDSCTLLQSVTIPNSVKTIGYGAFQYCNSLQSVTIGNGVEFIDDSAFYNCYKLAEVYDLSSLNITKGSYDNGYVGYYALDVYTSLETLSKLSTDENGFVIHDDGENKTLIAYVGTATEIEITNTVTQINTSALELCSSLQSVTIPDSVEIIGDYAFYGCYKLAEVYNLSSLEITKGLDDNGHVGCYALDVYTSLETPSKLSTDENGFVIHTDGETKTLVAYVGTASKIEIPNTVTQINISAFEHCVSLQSVTIPDSVEIIGDYAFSGCYKLAEVYNLSSLEITKGLDDNGHVGCYALDVYTSLETPSKLSTDENGFVIHTDGETKTLVAYVGTASKIEIPNTVTQIHDYAFDGCTSLQSVTIPNSVESIGNETFFGCKSLQSVTIGNAVQTIGYGAFEHCISLQSVTIPDSVQTIGEYAFWNCISLQSVTIGNSVQTIGYGAFEHCVSLQSVTIGNGVEFIDCYAFYDCDSLQSITISNSVESIGEYVFSGCDNLESITFEDTSTWYVTDDSTDCQNKTGGTETSVATPTTNVTNFISTYPGCYWYKV